MVYADELVEQEVPDSLVEDSDIEWHSQISDEFLDVAGPSNESVDELRNPHISSDDDPPDDPPGMDIEKAKQLKDQGNEALKNGDLDKAFALYTESLNCTPTIQTEHAAIVFSNIAATHIRAEKWEEAKEAASSAIELNPNYVKAYLRRYRANKALDKIHDAAADLKRACELDDNTRNIMANELRVVEQQSAKQFDKEKEEMIAKAKEFGSWALGKIGLSLDNFKVVQDPQSAPQ